jgi:signal transduction histidine kinase
VVIPLRTRDQILGVLTLGRVNAEQPYTAVDLRLAEDLGRRASVAIDTARLYEAAQAANQAKATFLAAISHDLRQPLNASLGFLDIALMGIRGDVGPELRQDLERVRRNQQHLLALINDVLSFARVEAGQLLVRREVVPLREIFEALPALVSPQADARGVALTIPSCPPTLNVLADYERVVQVFTNLLTNAIKATPAGGSVVVECEVGGDVILGRVRDSGVGIPAEMRERIFEPFVQVSRSLSRPEEGIGLGLSISRNLVRAMGGELTVESTVGRGSVFTVRLPSAVTVTPAMPMLAVAPASTGVSGASPQGARPLS